jgi:pimeloyl-ACP methyl ester carboxylesterase
MPLVTSLSVAAVAVALLIWGTVARARNRAARAERRYPATGQTLTVNGATVHSVTMGDGPAIVLIHGASGNLRDFTYALAPRLAAEGYRVIAFDRPGLGHSGRMDPGLATRWGTRAETITDQARLLSAAARQLGADRPLVLGHSYGGAVALAWGLDHPCAGVFGLAGVSMPWSGRLSLYYRILGSHLGGLIGPPLIAAWASRARLDQSIVDVFAPNPAPADYDAHFGIGLTVRTASLRANARQVNCLLGQMQDLSRRYGRMAVPVAFLHGDADLIVPLTIHAQNAVDSIPGATLSVLPHVGHMPHHVAQEATIAAIHTLAARAGLR